MPLDDLASVLARVSLQLAGERDEAVTAVRICELAVELVENCDHASLMLKSRRGRLRTRAASSSLCEELDERQLVHAEGPSLDAIETGEPQHSGRVAQDARWTSWGPQAAELGGRSVIAVPLRVGGEATGAMTLYSHQQDAWGRDGVDFALLYTTHAAIALDAAKVISGLETALTSRHQIGVAQGVLMERHGLTVGRAFTVLQRYSSTTNTPLSDVAARIVREADQAAASSRVGPGAPSTAETDHDLGGIASTTGAGAHQNATPADPRDPT
ncbi:GAF and ANTAR domain-containing protein [Nocardioides sp. R-C-SC26]|uniref:GAF and ANTAR domain-containing protein n=1 Tax=Nocardioides sp. R-C-SC26 TaxID=2870414 RepID=UPI001E56D738|nr:GAF and ANTAR domain-containing protein [Nocardioides sp. R-C-SC26]